MRYINRLTTIDKLPGYSTLGSRARNVCRHNNINTLGDLLNHSQEQLSRLRNCGPLCLKEIAELRERYDSFGNMNLFNYIDMADNTENCEMILSQLETEYRKYSLGISEEERLILSKVIPSPRDFFRYIDSDTDMILDNIKYVKWSEWHAAIAVMQDFIEYLKKRLETLNILVPDFDGFINDLESNGISRLALHHINNSPQIVRNHISTYYQRCFSTLSVRAQNVFRNIRTLEEGLPVLYSMNEKTLANMRNCGKKTCDEMIAFKHDVTEEINRRLLGIENMSDCSQLIDLYIEKYRTEYTFLTDDEVRYLAEYEMENNKPNAIYLLYRYVAESDHPWVAIQRDVWGINATGIKHSLSDTGIKYAITRERVRQIIVSGIPEDPIISQAISILKTIFTADVVSGDHPIWDVLERDCRYNLPKETLMGLIAMAIPAYTVDRFSDDTESVLIRRSLLGSVRFRTIITNLLTIYNLKRSDERVIDLEEAIHENQIRPVSDEEILQLCLVLGYIMSRHDGIEIEDNVRLIMHANSVDKIKAIEELLSSQDRPMTIDELYELYAEKYPIDPIKNKSSFHTYVLRSNRIVAMGRRGLYAMNDWKVYRGCITDILPEILGRSNAPMDIAELTRQVKLEFPNTNEKSVTTLLYLDNKGTYTMFDNNYVGLSNRDYPGWEARVRRPFRRASFDERFDEFKSFVRDNGRIPYSSSDEEESSLDRWRKNIMTGKVEVSSDQIASLSQFIDRNSHLPQTGTEYIFLRQCDAIKDLYTNFGRLPHNKHDNPLYIWFRKSLKMRGSWHDNREIFFADLVNWLNENTGKTF